MTTIPVKHFYMFLPSTADWSVHPGNTASHYRVQLPNSIDLREGTNQHWEVALTEITFTQQLRTFVNEKVIVRQMKGVESDRFIRSVWLPPGPHGDYYGEAHFMLIYAYAYPQDKILYHLENLRPPYFVVMNSAAAWELGFSQIIVDDRYMIRPMGEGQGIIAPFPPVSAQRPAGLRIDLYQDMGWQPKIVREVAVPLVPAYHSTPASVLAAVTEALKQAKADSLVTLVLTTDRFQWRILEETNNQADMVKLVQGAIEHDPMKPFSAKILSGDVPASLKNKTFTALYMTGDLASILGMHTSFTMAPLTNAVAPPDTDRGVINIYIYSNISRPTVVGNMLVPLLRSVALQRDNKNTVVSYTFKQPYYLPVDTDMLTTLEILLCDDQGAPIPFFHGRTQVVLHFRLMPGPTATAGESLE